MSELRWILFALGVFVVVYVYWRGRMEQRRRERSMDTRIEPTVRPAELNVEASAGERREPALGKLRAGMDEVEPPESVATPASPAAAPTWLRDPSPPEAAPRPHVGAGTPGLQKAVDGGTRKIVTLRIVRRGGGRISGATLLEALQREGLEFGDYRIFHRYAAPSADGGARTPIFSVANMVEPGEIDPERASQLELPGVAVFMVLPGAKAGPQALTDMLNTARRVATALDAELLDQNGSTMTRQTADHLRDEVIEFEHRHRSESQAGIPGR